MNLQNILLDHGSGGLLTQELIEKVFLPRFDNPVLSEFGDSAVIDMVFDDGGHGRIAFTTDSYVVDPIFFPGGDIGALAVNGTINDLSMRGAAPLFLSLGLILEEGLEMKNLERIADSIQQVSNASGVKVVTGDTKVVPRGKVDKIFINTSGIGLVKKGLDISASKAAPGDIVIISGTMADHGATILTRRPGLVFDGDLKSDTIALNRLVNAVIDSTPEGALHTLRDPTRGGVATALNEIARAARVMIEIDECDVPIRPEVRAACEILGLDPFHLANEGKCLAIVEESSAEAVVHAMRLLPEGRDAAMIGRVMEGRAGRVMLRTTIGGNRMLGPLAGEPLPRIC
jgi:hydrogenase expression/formation protein HypE